jgi:two-component system cell cycle response regulator
VAAKPTAVDDQRPDAVQPDGRDRIGTIAELIATLDAAEDNLEMGCDAEAAHALGVRVEAEATRLGEVELSFRARMLQADMCDRMGKSANVAQVLWEINRWASDHDCRALLARSHLLLARVYFYNLGDMAVCLDHALSAVETLEPTAPPHTRAYHLMKLADALKWNGSMEAARERFQQAERIAAAAGPVELLLMVLNNVAYGEYYAAEPYRAWMAAERMLAVAAEHGKQLNPAKVDTIARIQIALGRYAEAEQTIQAGMRTYEVRGYVHTAGRAEQLLTLAIARRHLGAIEQAQASLDRCRATCQEGGHAGIALRAQQEQAEIHAVAGNFQAAFEAHKMFYAESERMRSLQREALARTRQAMFETSEARQAAERFREQALRDPLTGLYNRRYADEQLPDLISRAAATGAPLTVAMIDIDHVKRVNDTYSHHTGDNVLITVANLLFTGVTSVARTGFVARVGGEEFLLVLPDTPLAEAAGHLDAVRGAIAGHHWQPLTGELPVTVSVGVASTEVLNGTAGALLAHADRNLYAAKRMGRNRVVGDPA